MAINTYYVYTTHVTCRFFTNDGEVLRCDDCGTLDDIHDRVCEILVKHNFTDADVCSAETGEVLMVVQRT